MSAALRPYAFTVQADHRYDLVTSESLLMSHKTGPRPFTDQEAFAALSSKYIPEPNTGCWLWTGALKSRGLQYGHMKFRGKYKGAHQVSYIMHKGEIPDGMQVCHKCDTPICINPDHLWLGTKRDNYQDCMTKNRDRRGIQYGTANGSAKLTWESVGQIRSHIGDVKDISIIFGVSAVTIRRILQGVTWVRR